MWPFTQHCNDVNVYYMNPHANVLAYQLTLSVLAQNLPSYARYLTIKMPDLLTFKLTVGLAENSYSCSEWVHLITRIMSVGFEFHASALTHLTD